MGAPRAALPREVGGVVAALISTLMSSELLRPARSAVLPVTRCGCPPHDHDSRRERQPVGDDLGLLGPLRRGGQRERREGPSGTSAAVVARLPAVFWSSSTRSAAVGSCSRGFSFSSTFSSAGSRACSSSSSRSSRRLRLRWTPMGDRPYTLTRRRWVNLNERMQFTAPAEHYDRFMGRYVPRLAVALADAAGVSAGMRVLDVGCGPGGLTHELAARVGEDHVAAIDPEPRSSPPPTASATRAPTSATARRRTCRSRTTASTRRCPRSSSPSCATRTRARARWRG